MGIVKFSIFVVDFSQQFFMGIVKFSIFVVDFSQQL